MGSPNARPARFVRQSVRTPPVSNLGQPSFEQASVKNHVVTSVVAFSGVRGPILSQTAREGGHTVQVLADAGLDECEVFACQTCLS